MAQLHTDLLEKNTDLTEHIHTLSQRLSTLIVEVQEATCERDNPQREVSSRLEL